MRVWWSVVGQCGVVWFSGSVVCVVKTGNHFHYTLYITSTELQGFSNMFYI